ncbi:MAG: YggS family pyridoxal phosphate-dependent enzyme [Xanthomonadales bacterium]|nr:YggS family pyridoxal phosphate-dependent enzyme [Xanthomonadales bacterium]
MNDLKENLHAVNTRVETACADAGRNPAEISVLAVSKKHPVERILALHRLGQRAFGENRIQEALPKIEALARQDIEWHFIGPLQSNKTREAAAVFDWVQSVDREKILRRLAKQRPGGLPPLNVLIQVNIDREPQKSGVPPEQARALAESAASLDGIRLRGLMAIPQAPAADQVPADSFRRMRELFRSLRERGLEIDTLSMGMSADLESAIMHGSTMVRIGTDLLGPRPSEAPASDEPTNRGTQSEC